MYLRLRRRILTRCRSLEFVSFRRILVEESRRYPVALQIRLRLSKLRPSMQRARYSMFPPPPQNLQELTEILQDPRYRVVTATHDGEDNLYAGSVTAGDDSHHVIFMSRRMAGVLRQLDYLFADGTFKVLPAIDDLDEASQVLAFVGNWDHTVIPLGWVLMERRTTLAYEAVLRTIRLLLRGMRNVQTVVTDFEQAIKRAFANVFPDVHQQGCFFHLVNAEVKYAKDELGMARILGVEPYSTLVRCFCALALLPERYIRRGFIILVRETRTHGPRVYRRMRPFIAYVLRQWVGNRERRQWMCVYGSIHRSNNTCESHNRMLLNFVGVPHPNIYNFIASLASMEANAYADAMALDAGERPGRARKLSSIFLDNSLRNLYRGIRNPPGNRDDAILRFLQRAVHTFDHAYDRAVDEA